MEIELLKKLVPYNILIGDPDCTDSHLVEVVEEFRPVIGFEGYYDVSSFGRVISVDRYVKSGIRNSDERFIPSEIKKQQINKGYKKVGLSLECKQFNKSVHRLVCSAFHENPEKKPTVSHLDCIPFNNYEWNLRWATQSENILHSVKLGRVVYTPYLQPKIIDLKKFLDRWLINKSHEDHGIIKHYLNGKDLILIAPNKSDWSRSKMTSFYKYSKKVGFTKVVNKPRHFKIILTDESIINDI